MHTHTHTHHSATVNSQQYVESCFAASTCIVLFIGPFSRWDVPFDGLQCILYTFIQPAWQCYRRITDFIGGRHGHKGHTRAVTAGPRTPLEQQTVGGQVSRLGDINIHHRVFACPAHQLRMLPTPSPTGIAIIFPPLCIWATTTTVETAIMACVRVIATVTTILLL